MDRIDYNIQNVASSVEEGFKQLQKVISRGCSSRRMCLFTHLSDFIPGGEDSEKGGHGDVRHRPRDPLLRDAGSSDPQDHTFLAAGGSWPAGGMAMAAGEDAPRPAPPHGARCCRVGGGEQGDDGWASSSLFFCCVEVPLIRLHSLPNAGITIKKQPLILSTPPPILLFDRHHQPQPQSERERERDGLGFGGVGEAVRGVGEGA